MWTGTLVNGGLTIELERVESVATLRPNGVLDAYSAPDLRSALLDGIAEQALREKVSAERSLLIVDNDRSFLQRLARALEQRGFSVATSESVADGLQQVEHAAPAFAVIEMRLSDGNGLDVICALKRQRPDARGIILTGYGNIATAVTAMKLGAVDYLAKPVDADDVVTALLAHDNCNAQKRDFLAYPVHLERWQESHLERASELAQRFDSLALPHDGDRSRAIAWWAYEQGETAGAHAWIDADRFVRLDGSWRAALGGGLRRVAEPPPPDYRA